MNITRDRLRKLVVGPGYIKEADFESADQDAKRAKVDIIEVIVERGLMQDGQLGKLIAEEIDQPFVDLDRKKIDEETLYLIPEPMARSKKVIAFSQEEEELHVGMLDVSDLETISTVAKHTGKKIVPYLVTKRALKDAFSGYKQGLKERVEKILAQLEDESLEKERRDELTVETVDLLLMYGHNSKASDIYIEPHGEEILIRFRVDGVLRDVLDLPVKLHPFILDRIKIMSKLRTDEHQSAQDGKFRFTVEGENIDVRVSIVPITKGENVVLRLLSTRTYGLTLRDLGLSDMDMAKIPQIISNPKGMILVSGPTGSGKTTTAYAIIRLLNKREVHIATIEDPVEYDIPGASQIQVNPKTNLTFAEGLRAIVRQDPDIIMVGEIRDEDTAEIAVNSAMTGHLVVTTLHANDAATTIMRLVEMGIEPFLITPTVNVAIAQRLVRRICEGCRVSYILSEEERLLLDSEFNMKKVLKEADYENLETLSLYKGRGCDFCDHTGYSGRIGIFEILEMTDRIKELILRKATHDEITEAAIEEGMRTILEDGMQKVLMGLITLDELLRVTRG